jgi:uncharacterized Zn-finger protein
MDTKILNFNPESSEDSLDLQPKKLETRVQSDLESTGYKCKYCNKHLSTKQSLREHSYIHTGQKPYKCQEPDCGQTFRQSSQLSYHKRIHIELKKFMSTNETPSIMKTSKSIELPELPNLLFSENDSTLNVHIKFHPVH